MNSIVRQVLKQIGLFDILNFRDATPIDAENVREWRFATGVAAAGETGGELLSNYEGQVAQALLSDLFKGLTEAMTNTGHHAYGGSRGDGLPEFRERRWWMLSEEREGTLSVAVCDLGIGIPRSLPRSPAFDDGLIRLALKAFGADRREIDSIKLAVGHGFSVTRKPNRGKGLGEIMRAVQRAERGRVYIASNRAVYGFDSERDTLEHQYKQSIYGTLIEWGLLLDDGRKDNDPD